MRNVSDKICGENQNIIYVQKFLFENRSIYEIIGKYIVEQDWSQITTCHAGYLRLQQKFTTYHFTAFPLQKWMHENASLLGYMYLACLVSFDC
jgi:hypothetical protein